MRRGQREAARAGGPATSMLQAQVFANGSPDRSPRSLCAASDEQAEAPAIRETRGIRRDINLAELTRRPAHSTLFLDYVNNIYIFYLNAAVPVAGGGWAGGRAAGRGGRCRGRARPRRVASAGAAAAGAAVVAGSRYPNSLSNEIIQSANTDTDKGGTPLKRCQRSAAARQSYIAPRAVLARPHSILLYHGFLSFSLTWMASLPLYAPLGTSYACI